jgi:hypothetical protein
MKNKIIFLLVSLFFVFSTVVAVAQETASSGGNLGAYQGRKVVVSSQGITIQPIEGTISGGTGIAMPDGTVGNVPAPVRDAVCGNNICETGEFDECGTCDSEDPSKPCPLMCSRGTCPKDCENIIEKNGINVNVPSSFSIREGQTANLDYQDMKITLLSVNPSEEPAPCPPIAKPLCTQDSDIVKKTDNNGCVSYTCVPKACTQDAKICPDGSAVGRTGPNCEFATCPGAGAVAKASVATQTVSPESSQGVVSSGVVSVATGGGGAIPISKGYARISVSTPGGCGPNADPRCLGPPAFSKEYKIGVGREENILGLTIKLLNILEFESVPSQATFHVYLEKSECPEGCACDPSGGVACPAQTIGVEVQSSQGVKRISVESVEGKVSFTDENVKVKTESKIVVDNQRLYMETKEGNREVKIMPSVASDVALNQLRLKGFEIQLKEVGKPVYEVDGTKEARLFGLIKRQMKVTAQIDAETGDVIKTNKPWWSFLASE